MLDKHFLNIVPWGIFFPFDCFNDVFLVLGRGLGGGLCGGVQNGEDFSTLEKFNDKGSTLSFLISTVPSIILDLFCFDLAGDCCLVVYLVGADELTAPLLEPLLSSIALATF